MIRRRTPKKATALSASLPPPIGGLNARDSVALMPETDALILDNFFPQATSVDLRKGYSSHATFTGQAESVMVYTSTAAKLFVGVKNGTTYSIYDATSGGALSAAVVGGASNTVQALTSGRFEALNVGTTGGQFMLVCNGADPMLLFDGTSWNVASGITGITGGTQSISSLALYGERVWLMEKNSLRVWYLGTGAISGAATALNLQSLFKLGGTLACIVTWSADSSSDLADFIAFVSTQGEVVAFTGDDPSSAATWARVATVRIGRPVTTGQRAWTQVGGEAFIITVDGVFPLSQAILQGRVDTSKAITDKIRNLINADVLAHGSRYGWALTLHPAGQKLILNVPTGELSTSRQYVMNTQTGAWCRFTGWNAYSWAVAGDKLYFGGNGVLAEADTGTDDNGSVIQADAKQAFSYFGRRGMNKRFTMMRPILSLDGDISLGLDINVDYEDRAPSSTVAIGGNAGDPWSVAWDAAWGGASTIHRAWTSVRGIGFAAAPRLRVHADEVRVSWSASDFVFEPAGIL